MPIDGVQTPALVPTSPARELAAEALDTGAYYEGHYDKVSQDIYTEAVQHGMTGDPQMQYAGSLAITNGVGATVAGLNAACGALPVNDSLKNECNNVRNAYARGLYIAPGTLRPMGDSRISDETTQSLVHLRSELPKVNTGEGPVAPSAQSKKVLTQLSDDLTSWNNPKGVAGPVRPLVPPPLDRLALANSSPFNVVTSNEEQLSKIIGKAVDQLPTTDPMRGELAGQRDALVNLKSQSGHNPSPDELSAVRQIFLSVQDAITPYVTGKGAGGSK